MRRVEAATRDRTRVLKLAVGDTFAGALVGARNKFRPGRIGAYDRDLTREGALRRPAKEHPMSDEAATRDRTRVRKLAGGDTFAGALVGARKQIPTRSYWCVRS